MNCQTCCEQMADLADARLDEKAVEAMRSHMDGCPACAREFQTITRTLGALDSIPSGAPSPRLRARVTGLIESEKLTLKDEAGWAASVRAAAAPGPGRRHPWWPVALQAIGACALVAVGFALGERRADEHQLELLRSRVDTMGQIVEQSVLQKSTAGDRLETVMTAAAVRKPDERVIDGLINSMAFDTSVNVRLNALGALYSHADQEVVRAGVVACLAREPNPLVQVSMIDFLVASRAREASPELQRLAADEHADADVRESARRAVDLL
jgi:HEAT repeats